MALKDWKKDSRFGIAGWESNDGTTIAVERTMLRGYGGAFLVRVIKDSMLIRESKKFKTKPQALKFAKAYMKSDGKKLGKVI
jgi:hypothetical protein